MKVLKSWKKVKTLSGKTAYIEKFIYLKDTPNICFWKNKNFPNVRRIFPTVVGDKTKCHPNVKIIWIADIRI